MTKLTIDPKVAVTLGADKAIVIQQIDYWIKKAAKGKNIGTVHEGVIWIYNSLAKWQEQFPFMSASKIRRIFTELKEDGYLRSEQLSGDKRDRTNWYTLNYGKLQKIGFACNIETPYAQNEHMHEPNLADASAQNEHMYIKESKTTSKTTSKNKTPHSPQPQEATTDPKTPTPEIIEEVVVKAVEPKQPPTGKPAKEHKPRARDLVWDMLAWEWFDSAPNTLDFAALGASIAQHVAWLKGHDIVIRRKNQPDCPVPGCKYTVDVQAIRKARADWNREHPGYDRPKDIAKFIRYLSAWLDKNMPDLTPPEVVVIPTADWGAVYESVLARVESGEFDELLKGSGHDANSK